MTALTKTVWPSGSPNAVVRYWRRISTWPFTATPLTWATPPTCSVGGLCTTSNWAVVSVAGANPVTICFSCSKPYWPTKASNSTESVTSGNVTVKENAPVPGAGVTAGWV